MNMHAVPRLTPTEEALIERFSQVTPSLPGSPRVAEQRDQAMDLLRVGLPTRRVEAWHYTDLRRLLDKLPESRGEQSAQPVAPLIEGSTILSVLDGRSQPAGDHADIRIEKFEDRLVAGNVGVEFDPLDVHDTVGAINTAFVSGGFGITVPDGVQVDMPFEVQNVHAGGGGHARFGVQVGAGARVTFVERQTGTAEALVSSISDLDVGDGARVDWLIIQEQPVDAMHLAQLNARIGKDAQLTVFVMNTGGKLIRQEIRVVAAGEGSDLRLRGVNLLGGDTHCDITMVLDHAAPHTTSTEIIRNVITDRAHGVFQGQIRVDRLAQKTDAKMACNTLLLSDDGEFSAKPELEIFADDVACGHGATVTEIDGDHLFYLMARGIDEKFARGLLVKAFLREIVEELDDEQLIEAIEARLEDWFIAHG